MPLAAVRYNLRVLLVSSLFVVLSLLDACVADELTGANAFFWGFNDTVRIDYTWIRDSMFIDLCCLVDNHYYSQAMRSTSYVHYNELIEWRRFGHSAVLHDRIQGEWYPDH